MKTIRLCRGKGIQGKSHCVMAATSIVAGEPFSDDPKCVCKCITSLLITLNDSYYTDATREKDLSHLPWLIIGTNGGLEVAYKRADLIKEWAKENLKISCEGVDFYNQLVNAANYEGKRQELINFIEKVLIPVHTTMTIEPGYRQELLIT